VILRGAGGAFVKRAEYPTARYGETIGVTAGDLNRDLIADLVVSNGQSHQILAFLGRGDGTFTSGDVVNVRTPGRTIVTDADGDGDADVVFANGDITVVQGKRDGGFQPRREFATGTGGSGFGHAVGDVDGDGILDVVAATATSTVSLLRGRGGGSFEPSQEIDVGGSSYAIALADLDSDRQLDLIVGIYSTEGAVTVLRGRGDGTFGPPVVVANLGDYYPVALRTADFDRNGSPDVAVARTNDVDGIGGITVLLGAGDGSISGQRDYAGNSCQDLCIADIDENATLDVLAVDSWGGVLPFLGRGTGEFEPGRRQWLVHGAWSVGAGDFDRDGHVDVAIGTGVYENQSGVEILMGDGHGSFTRRTSYMVHEPRSVAVADLDRDGLLDVAAGSYSWGPEP